MTVFHYAVRTTDGWVGRWTVAGPLEGNLPRQYRYTWTDFFEVEAVAAGFPDAEIRVIRTESA